MPVLDALEALEELEILQTSAKVLAIPIWEGQLMIQLKMTEEEYIQLPKEERARKIVAMKLGEWIQLLDFVMREEERG